MLNRYLLLIFVGVFVTWNSAEDCVNGIGNCTLADRSNETTHSSSTLRPRSMNMLAEEALHKPLHNDPKSRALNFTESASSTTNALSSNSTTSRDMNDLSDVTIHDDEDMDEELMITPKILNPKSDIQSDLNMTHTTNSTAMCEKEGLTYENGEKLEIDCDQTCTCTNGTMNCVDRCTGPFFRKGKKISDPLCTAKDVEDQCCSILVCSADTETEPLEMCSFENLTYHRGQTFKKGCKEICTCEIAGQISCKPRCPEVNKTNDRCVELPDPNDSCCKTVFCDVTLNDKEEEDEEMQKYKIINAKYINATTLELKIEPNFNNSGNPMYIEASSDGKKWQTYFTRENQFVDVMEGTKFVRFENSDIIEITNISQSNDEFNDLNKEQDDCFYNNRKFKIGEEFNDNCTSLCVCRKTGMKCLKLECPTYFGVDVLNPNCVEWETEPPNFKPSPPNCCPEKLQCKNNGSCIYEGLSYQNWQQLPINVTGCDKRCYCEMGNVECQNTCPPITALPSSDIPCHPSQAKIDYLPDDDCCKQWVCASSATGHKTKTDKNKIKSTTEKSLVPKTPSRNLGPLLIYENSDNKTRHNPSQPSLSSNENFYYNKESFLGSGNPIHKKHNKNQKPLFVTPPPNENHIPNAPIKKPNTSPDEILQFIHQHPEISNYPSGSVVEIHKLPTKPSNPFINGRPPHQIIPTYAIPHQVEESGLTLEQILQEVHRNAQLPGQIHEPLMPFPSNNYNNGPILVAPQSPIVSNRFNSTYQGAVYGTYPMMQSHDDITVTTLEPIDAHTVRLAFAVPSVIVGLHGRVEVRYTHLDDPDLNTWELQVFAPPNDLIATHQLEFELLDLKADTEYKIKIVITLRDLHNTPSSRVYKIRTLKEQNITTLPQMIPITPDLAITDINATWVTVVWRKFTEYELQFIDGLQLRFKEIDGKVYNATPLTHRMVTSYTLENLKPNTKYEVGIFFIPFAGQQTELHADKMLHFTTANEVDTYGFNVSLDIGHVKSTSVEITWSGVPYPEDKYVNIYRAIYQSDTGKEDQNTFKIAKRDSPTKTVIMDLKPGTRYRLWLEVYLTNGKIKTSNVQDFITKPRIGPSLGASSQQDKLSSAEKRDRVDYYGPLVIVAILASIAVLSTLILLLILVKRHNQSKAAITPPSTRISQSAYDNPTYKVEIQQETMGL